MSHGYLHSILLQLGFVLLALIWEYDFPPFMVLIIAILNDGNVSIHYASLHVFCSNNEVCENALATKFYIIL